MTDPSPHGAETGYYPHGRRIRATRRCRVRSRLARGHLLKSSLDDELLGTIRAVHAGKKAISADASYELAEHVSDDVLTPAEVRVLRLNAGGNANKPIAEPLSLSEETVKGQVRNILSETERKGRTHPAMIGLMRGIINP